MNQVFAALDAGWRVLLAGVLLGAGLPSIFALGLRNLAWGAGAPGPDGTPTTRNPLGVAIAVLLFTIVGLSILLGLGYILAHGLGYSITFSGVLPTITKK